MHLFPKEGPVVLPAPGDEEEQIRGGRFQSNIGSKTQKMQQQKSCLTVRLEKPETQYLNAPSVSPSESFNPTSYKHIS